jgi:hypothetical protein
MKLELHVAANATDQAEPDDVRHGPGEASAENQIKAGEDAAAPLTEVAGEQPIPTSGLPETGKF